jgi:DNA-directed RNA polymerase subunit RPC12/RpoP
MPPRRPPFIYIPPSHIMPIECPHCEDTAHPLWHSPLPAGLKGEMRVFECVGCGRESRLIVNA